MQDGIPLMPFLLSPHLGLSKAHVAPRVWARTGHVWTPAVAQTFSGSIHSGNYSTQRP